MMKKILSATTVAVAAVGASAVAAPHAMADDDLGSADSANGTSNNGNGSMQQYGNQSTHGNMSPQMAIIQGSLNKPCLDLLHDTEIQNIVGLVNVGLQDIPILSQKQQQVCTENSTQAEGDAPLSHLLEDVPIVGENGAGNS
ncbi:rodlin [Streptomyces sp. ODS28]|uniref:rodlin n=1 Tax=Streptomyces sp. ODS28 TaxID=3136688 RepID=UPI0031EF8D09